MVTFKKVTTKGREAPGVGGVSPPDQQIFTRYLYNINDVQHSLLLSLVTSNSDFLESLFWTSELYYSGFKDNIWELIWKIYYDFYAINNPKYEKSITKFYRKWKKSNKIKYLLKSISLIHHTKIKNVSVFYLRILNPTSSTKKYSGRTPNWIKQLELEKSEKSFIRALHDKNLHNIKYYLSKIENNFERTYELIINYFIIIHGFNLRQKSRSDVPYKNKKHILYGIICYLLIDIGTINRKVILKKITKDDINFVINTNKKINPIYKTLTINRLFSVSANIGYFNIKHTNDCKDKLWFHWEYFIRNCPLWEERINKYKGKFNEEKKKIEFINDDLLEEFYDNFGFEPDEQNLECQNKSIGKLECGSLIDFISLLNIKTQLLFPNISINY
jgi:hypothetical protein